MAAAVFMNRMRERRMLAGPSIPWNPNHSSQFETDHLIAPLFPESSVTSKIELTISSKDIAKTHAIRQKSNPFCVVYMKRPWQDKFKEIGRTETIENTLNPEWTKKIIVDYNFETIQNLKFEILDKDLKKGEFLGRFETTLSKLVASYGCQSIGKLYGKVDGIGFPDAGEIIIVAEEVATCKLIAEIQLSAEQLPKPWLRNINPFLAISRSNEDGTHSIVTKVLSEPSPNGFIWRAIKTRLTTLCNGDSDRQFKIDCYDLKLNGSHKFIGSCYASLSNLISMHKNNEVRQFVNEEKQKTKPSYVPRGILKVDAIHIGEDITFLEYIRYGTQMHFAVAIDFTASNGVYTDPKSLHYLSEDRLNQYEIALRGIGDIVQVRFFQMKYFHWNNFKYLLKIFYSLIRIFFFCSNMTIRIFYPHLVSVLSYLHPIKCHSNSR